MSRFRGWLISTATAVVLTVLLPLALGNVATFSPPVSDQSPPDDMVRWVSSFGLASPNGDGCSDSATVYVDFYWADTLSDEYWSVTIRDSSGTSLFFSESNETIPQHVFSWPEDPVDLADGLYQVTVYARAIDVELGFIEDYATGTVSVDLTPPKIVSKIPSESRAAVSVDAGSTTLGVAATYSLTSDREVKVVFNEDVGGGYYYFWPYRHARSSLHVYSETGLRAAGYSQYDYSTHTLTFHASSPGLIGNYRAVVNAWDLACNNVSDEWQFTAVAPSTSLY